jgi:hypothetical protein
LIALKTLSYQFSNQKKVDFGNDVSKKQIENPIRSFFGNLIPKIKAWKIFGNHPKPASFVTMRYHLIDSDTELIGTIPWKATTVNVDGRDWLTYFDDKGRIWFYPKNSGIIYSNLAYSDCNISLLFSKKNHQMVLVENNNRFSYLVPSGKQLQILPLTDKDIAGVMKVNFIDPERLVVVKKDSTNPSSDRLNLYLFKD